MSKKLVLKAVERTASGSAEARRVRKSGNIPAIIYNEKTETKKICINAIDAKGLSSVHGMISLDLDGKEIPAIVKEIQYNHLSGRIFHIDFMEVDLTHTVKATVPVVVIGTAAGLPQGGQLVQNIHEIEIKSLPADLPERIEVDSTPLNINDSVFVKDMVLPKGVEVLTNGDLMVCQVELPRAEEAVKTTVVAPAAAPAKK